MQVRKRDKITFEIYILNTNKRTKEEKQKQGDDTERHRQLATTNEKKRPTAASLLHGLFCFCFCK